MSWDDQVAAKESRGLVSGAVSALQAPLLTSLMPHGSNHGIAESASQLGGGSAEPGTCDMTCDCDLWDGEHHVASLSGHPGYIENDARVIASSVMCITRFIQKYSIEGRSIEQFPPILGIGAIMWQLF